jgi:hypothetical protein
LGARLPKKKVPDLALNSSPLGGGGGGKEGA